MLSNTKTIDPQSIIIRMPNWLGDLVMATPIIADLYQKWPSAKIDVLCQSALGAVLEADPRIHRVIPFKGAINNPLNQTPQTIQRFLKTQKYDLGILLTNSFSSAWMFFWGAVSNRIGFQGNWRRFFLNYPVAFPKNRESQHLVLTYKELLKPLGIALSHTSPYLCITTEEQQKAYMQLAQLGVQSNDFVIGINPGAAYGSAKCWLPERFEALTHHLLTHSNVKIIYFGDAAGKSLVDRICEKMPERVIHLAGKTNLRSFIAFIQQCHLFLTNDSGPMHVASALNIPLIALFGSTSDVTTGPYKGGTVIHKHVECSPCYLRECPIDFRCMKRITVEEVYELIQEWLKNHEK